MARGVDVLTDPGRFFAEAGDDPKARYPVLIVLAISVVGTLTVGFIITKFLGSTDFGGALAAIVSVLALIGQIIGNLFIWFLYSAVMFAIASLLDGQGEFKETMVFVGWGFLPRIVGAVVSSIVSFVTLSDVEPPNISGDNPAVVQQEVQRFATEAAGGGLGLVAALVGIAVLLWSAYIWLHAIEAEHELERDQALIAVGIPVGLALLWRLNGLLGVL